MYITKVKVYKESCFGKYNMFKERFSKKQVNVSTINYAVVIIYNGSSDD